MKYLLLLILFPCLVYSQSWIDKMQDPAINFYDTQKDFEEYWKNKTIEKGKGWKQFKRWENFIEQRVFPDGVLHPEMLFEEARNIQLNNQFNMPPPNIWTQVGPNNVPLESSGRKRGIGRVNTIAFHPTDANTLYVGAPAGGFWKSVNGGQTWTTSTDFLTNLGVSDIAIHPTNPDIIYIVTGDRDGGDTYSYGLMKSIDGGLSFNSTGLSFSITDYYKGNRVLIDPNNTDVIIVATSNGIYRSVDAGATFANTFSSANMTDIEFHTTNTNIIYGGSKGNTSIYKSIDNGISWAQAGSGLPSTNDVVRACVAVTPSNPLVVYALFGDNSNGFYGVYKSSDEGATWTQQANSPNLLGWSTSGSDNDGQAWYDLAFTVDPTNEDVLFVGGVNCWKSTNSGVSWNINTHWYGGGGANYMHADEHMLKYNPLDNKIYSANDGGLYLSSDNGNNWTDISDGLHITQFYSLGVSQTVQDKVITGAQDNGTFLKTASNWDAVIGGDGMECIIDYTNSNIMYGEVYYGAIRKSTNGGNSFSSIAPSNNGAWETPYELHKTNPEIIYAGYDELYISFDGGDNWSTITNGETNGGKINEIGLSASNPDVIYFTDDANIFKTADGGSNWTLINNNLPYKYISYVIVHPTDENKVWATFSGYTVGEKVYKTVDGGNNWINISGTLPNLPVNCIELDKTDTLETVYIGTDLGVYISDSTLTDWNQYNNNSLPNVIVTELEIQYQSNKLIASTYGRGLWDITLEITSPPVADFSYNDSIFCNVPADVTFLNNSYYSNSYYWDFGDGATSTSTNPTHTYTSFGLFTVQLIANGPLGSDSIILSQIISIDQNNPCIVSLPVSGAGNTQTMCNGNLYDVGGPNSNYFDNNNCWMTIAPPGSNQITLNFISFDIEAPSSSSYCNWDYLEIFDGADTSSPSLGQYCNALTGSPGTIISSGGALTVYLHSDQAVNGTGFEASWSCTFPSAPPVSSFEISDSVSCNTNISFTDFSTNGPTNWYWDFGDGNSSILQNPIHNYNNSGIYTIKLITTNAFGVDTLILIDAITIIDLNLSTVSATSCGSDSLSLSANTTSGIINWYSDPQTTNLVGTGSNYTTPILSTSTTYYAQSVYTFPTLYGGPSDNNFGSGSYYQGNKYLIFNNYKVSTLKSVLVYANSAGYRTIELRNSSNAILSDTNIYIPFSPNGFRIDINFSLPIQNNMQLGIDAPNSDLFRTSSGAIFPYNISDIVYITGTNAPVGYYYFFYDWEIVADPCISNISPTLAIIEQTYTSYQNLSICGGDSVLVGSNYYNVSGIYTDTLSTISGCDSIITTQLSVGLGVQYYQQISLCSGQGVWVGSNFYTSSGIYTDTIGVNGCDSIVTTELLILNNPIISTSQTICQGESYSVGVNIYTSPGIYLNVLETTSGCDSTIITNLTVIPNIYQNQNIELCENESIQIGNNIYNQNGIYTDTLISSIGCDSILTTQVSLSYFDLLIDYNTISLNVNTSGGSAPFIFIWNTNETTQSIIPQMNGMYWCIATDVNGCQSDTVFYYIEPINATDEQMGGGIKIYPNPTTGLVYIDINSIHKNTQLFIYTILGEIIFAKTFAKSEDDIKLELDISSFSKGVYLIEIQAESRVLNHKLILE